MIVMRGLDPRIPLAGLASTWCERVDGRIKSGHDVIYPLTTFLLRRLALVPPTLFFVSVLIFGLQQLLPGDPALALAGEDRNPAVVEYLRQEVTISRTALDPVICCGSAPC